MTHRHILFASLASFAIACCLPSLTFLGAKGDTNTWPGVAVLAMGCLAALYGQFAWFANVFWLIGVVLLFLKKPRAARVASALVILFALNCATLRSLRIPEDESGSAARASVSSLGPGFYFWIASLILLFAVSYWKDTARSSS